MTVRKASGGGSLSGSRRRRSTDLPCRRDEPARTMIGQSAGLRISCRPIDWAVPLQPAARCGLETAVLDAYCRSQGVPLWRLWGAADIRDHQTDITIPICGLEKTVALSRAWYGRGFRLFKMKVGTDVGGHPPTPCRARGAPRDQFYW